MRKKIQANNDLKERKKNYKEIMKNKKIKEENDENVIRRSLKEKCF